MKNFDSIPMNRRKIGADKEGLALRYLEALGYRIIERNFRNRIGEIDLIGIEGSELAFIEVKYRKDDRYGYPSFSVGKKKQSTISKVALYFLAIHPQYAGFQCRFDVVCIMKSEITLYRNAFEYRGR